MLAKNYDIITVGGGIAASALAKAMAEQGARVLVLERETYIPSSRASRMVKKIVLVAALSQKSLLCAR